MLIDHLNKIKGCVVPEKQLSIYESMLLGHDRLVFGQHIKNKYGVKSFELCQHDGLILRGAGYIVGNLGIIEMTSVNLAQLSCI